MSSRSYRGFHVKPVWTDPDSPYLKAYLDRNTAPSVWPQFGAPPEPFKGITTDGYVRGGLYKLERTGANTGALCASAEAFISSLDAAQRTEAFRPVLSSDWMLWFNGCEMPYGASLRNATEPQREAFLNLLRATLSARGYEQVWRAMQFNEVLGEIIGNTISHNTWNYAVAVFGAPSTSEPWGWQLQGHHVVVSCFVLGDQVVMTPLFIGAEPAIIDDGPLKGQSILREEEQAGFDFIHLLDRDQRRMAIVESSMLEPDLPPGRYIQFDQRIQSGARKDNIILPYEGISAAHMSSSQRDHLVSIMEVYASRLPPQHASVKMNEISRHLEETHFAWIGSTGPSDPFYYKIHSPVILIEFDHHSGVVLDNKLPEKFHVHTQVRTPNGNDYGRDLLRQHYELHHRPDHQHHTHGNGHSFHHHHHGDGSLEHYHDE